jgi:hypothetical protein
MVRSQNVLHVSGNLIDRDIAVLIDKVEYPADDGLLRQTAGEDPTAHGAETDRRIHPVVQPEMFDRRGAATDAGDDGADEASRAMRAKFDLSPKSIPQPEVEA